MKIRANNIATIINEECVHMEIPVYAFSIRESIDKEINGEIIKTSIFKHIGFVE